MNTGIDTAVMQRFPCFEGLTEAEAAVAARSLEPVHLDRGQVVFHQGDASDTVYLLVSGQIEIKVHVPGQTDRLLSTLESGSIFGEISLLLAEPRTAAAVAATDVQLWQISRAAFQTAMERRDPWSTKFLLAMGQVLARRLANLDQQLVTLIAAMHTGAEEHPAVKVAELEQLRDRLFSQWSF